MNGLRFAYCDNCKSLVEYIFCEEIVEEISESGEIKYELHKVGRCKNCDCIVISIIYDYTRQKVNLDYNEKRK